MQADADTCPVADTVLASAEEFQVVPEDNEEHDGDEEPDKDVAPLPPTPVAPIPDDDGVGFPVVLASSSTGAVVPVTTSSSVVNPHDAYSKDPVYNHTTGEHVGWLYRYDTKPAEQLAAKCVFCGQVLKRTYRGKPHDASGKVSSPQGRPVGIIWVR